MLEGVALSSVVVEAVLGGRSLFFYEGKFTFLPKGCVWSLFRVLCIRSDLSGMSVAGPLGSAQLSADIPGG